MAWIAADCDNETWVYVDKPERMATWFRGTDAFPVDEFAVNILIGRKLTWEDEPVQIGIIDGE